ncbi:MAG TPA: enoyl-CoA hydratase/isomerase family protein [Burkholderiales bacterium]|nr:enoyl-CoA hydratase/isomerase family protein [Burkholderiales bacterium]
MSVSYSMVDGVATVTLNRPEARNAVNLAMCDALIDAAQRAAADPSVRVVLVRAKGPAFCAGADLKEREGMVEAQVRERRKRAFAAYAALEALPMPSIAVVCGPAVGSGCEIAAACDFIVATPEASFRTPEALRGTVGATQRLPRVLGKRLAKDMMFTGRALTAEDAKVAGLVSRIFPNDVLEMEIGKLIEIIVKGPAWTLRLAKRAIDRGVELDPRGALEAELEAIEAQLASGEWMGKR